MSETRKSADLPPKAGETESFPSGKLTFLSPKPLPTGLSPVDHGHAVGEVNEGYLDFGVGMPPVFGWQMMLGGPFGLFVLMAFGFPLIAFLVFYWLGDGWDDGVHALRGVFDYGFPIAVGGGASLSSCFPSHAGRPIQILKKLFPLASTANAVRFALCPRERRKRSSSPGKSWLPGSLRLRA